MPYNIGGFGTACAYAVGLLPAAAGIDIDALMAYAADMMRESWADMNAKSRLAAALLRPA